MNDQLRNPLSSHIPALDGVRGIAILLVLMNHGIGLSSSSPNNDIDDVVLRVANVGWAGVDLFFVLSGFLITGILLDSRGSRGGIVSFYGRRILRIVPVYFVLLLSLMFILPLIPRLHGDPDVAILRSHQAWYWSFMLNIKVMLQPLDSLGRFGNGHLWSLMVEEQFYLVWPFLMLLLPKRALLPTLFVCIISAPIIRYALLEGAVDRFMHGFSPAIFMPARMDTLALGGLVAFCVREPRLWRALRASLPFVGVTAAAIVLGLVAYYHQFWNYDRGVQIAGYSAIAALFAVFVACAVDAPAGSRLSTVLSHPVLRFFGKYSYAIFVFHFQIMVEVARRWDDNLFLGSHTLSRLLFALITIWFSVVVAWLSWNIYERRILALKRYLPYAQDRAKPRAAADQVVAGAGGS